MLVTAFEKAVLGVNEALLYCRLPMTGRADIDLKLMETLVGMGWLKAEQLNEAKQKVAAAEKAVSAPTGSGAIPSGEKVPCPTISVAPNPPDQK